MKMGSCDDCKHHTEGNQGCLMLRKLSPDTLIPSSVIDQMTFKYYHNHHDPEEICLMFEYRGKWGEEELEIWV